MVDTYKIPKAGDEIYVDTSLYLGHGIDDFIGGKAQVWEVYEEQLKNGDKIIWITVVEHMGCRYNWTVLSEEQEKLKHECGERRAYPSPDLRIEFNEPPAFLESLKMRERYVEKAKKGRVLSTRVHGIDD